MENIREELHKRQEEFAEKYSEVARNLSIKYGKTTDFGIGALEGIARGVIYNVEPLYVPDIDYDKEAMVEDYREIERLSKMINGDIPLE